MNSLNLVTERSTVDLIISCKSPKNEHVIEYCEHLPLGSMTAARLAKRASLSAYNSCWWKTRGTVAYYKPWAARAMFITSLSECEQKIEIL